MIPAISVIMTVYNTEKYLNEAIESILTQTFTNFELIIIDDASTDNSNMIIESYTDKRIRIVHNKENLGASRSSNIGLKMARGKYIARMDSDDISLPERLSKQYHYMELRPDVAILGTWAKVIGEQEAVLKYPKDDRSNKCKLFFNVCFAHSSIMIRQSILEMNNIIYNSDFVSAIDYELYSQFPSSSIFENIPEILYVYRKHQKQMSVVRRSRQLAQANLVRLKQLQQLEISPSEEEFKLHVAICERDYSKNFPEYGNLDRVVFWLEYLRARNNHINIFDANKFEETLANYWLSVCESCSHIDSKIWAYYFNSSLSKCIELPERQVSLDHLVALLGVGRRVAIFGTGRMAYFLSEQLSRVGYIIEAFLDNNKDKVGNKLNEVGIYNPEWLNEHRDQIDSVLISILGDHDKEIKAQLETISPNSLSVFSWKQVVIP